MKLNKALKHKKKLIKQADEYYNRFARSNSRDKQSSEVYNPEEMFDKWRDTTDELITLKAKIQEANVPILGKIFALSELKNMIHRLKNVNTNKGIVKDRYSVDTHTEYICFMDEVAKDKLISELEEKIEAIQEEIETFNATTKI